MMKFMQALDNILVAVTFAEHGIHDLAPLRPEPTAPLPARWSSSSVTNLPGPR